MHTSATIRRGFIEFFRERGHAVVPPSSVVPYDDPTLLFTNAGMNQFKDVFLGTGTRSYRRAVNSQPCIRAGGKHNDLDDVGHDTYHHTFFEMLGNWSFGDYFKREAIAWAWELLTKVWGMDQARLHATYFGGDSEDGLPPDIEARDLWTSVTNIDPAHVHAFGRKDNFWEMGETGPCGPCSEIHVDLTPDRSGGKLVNTGDARVIEIWNLVFIQFNRGADGRLAPLPDKHVDTGMGLERVAAVLGGHHNNYATESFVPILQAIERLAGHRYGGDRADRPAPGAAASRYAIFRANSTADTACRVIADHVRTLTFALADGALPDKDGRGYVLRRILRRGVRYGWQYLKLHEPFLCKLVPPVVDVLGEAFPKLLEHPARIVDIVREEEEAFDRTLERGLALFEDAAARARHAHHGEIRGEDAFRLHDTYGFPVDLTQIMAEEKGLRVDIGEYERLMDQARERARGAGDQATDGLGALRAELVTPFGPTDDSHKYTTDTLQATIVAIVKFDTASGPMLLSDVGGLSTGEIAVVVLDRTCFYGEQGGQVGDTGHLLAATTKFAVERTARIGDTVAHYGTLLHGKLTPGQTVELRVDRRREQIKRNHTATHVLNWALREVLGDHVQQRGSQVDDQKTRFDFSHPRALLPDELDRVERLCHEQVGRNLTVFDRPAPQAAARAINGLRAVFGEKYPDTVRVVSIGAPVEQLLADPGNAEWRGFSIEFCGGTHVRSTGQIEHFVLTVEEAVGKGVRRIVGVSGQAARLIEQMGDELLREAVALKSSPPAQLAERLAALQSSLNAATLTVRHRDRLRDAVAELQQIVRAQSKRDAAASAGVANERAAELLGAAKRVNDTMLVVGEMPDVPLDQLKNAADGIKQKARSAAVLFGVRAADGRAVLLAAVTDDLIRKGVKAGDWVKAIAPLVDGGGGGPPTMAQAGGKNAARLAEALRSGREWAEARL
jgi:alanyl-tRNA synthetase